MASQSSRGRTRAAGGARGLTESAGRSAGVTRPRWVDGGLASGAISVPQVYRGGTASAAFDDAHLQAFVVAAAEQREAQHGG